MIKSGFNPPHVYFLLKKHLYTIKNLADGITFYFKNHLKMPLHSFVIDARDAFDEGDKFYFI